MSRSSIMERQPCPVRIFSDSGGALSIGLVLGLVFHGVKINWKMRRIWKKQGFRTILPMTRRTVRKASRLAFKFCAWGTSFSVADCVLATLRRKEDVWNPIIAGTCVGMTLPMRKGPKSMIFGAIGGFVVLSVMEAVMVWLQARQVPDQSRMAPVGLPPGVTLPSAGGTGEGGTTASFGMQ